MFSTEIEIILRNDTTTNGFIEEFAAKRSILPEQVTKDVSKMFLGYAAYLVRREKSIIRPEQEYGAMRAPVSHFARKYEFSNDTVNKIMEKLEKALKKSTDIPSAESVREDSVEEEQSGIIKRKFKLFLVCATSILIVINHVQNRRGRK